MSSRTGLAGVETISRGTTGIVTIDLRAQGGLDAIAAADTPGASVVKPTASPITTLHTTRNIGPVSGLVRDSRDISEATILDGDTPHTTRIETIITVTPPDKGPRYPSTRQQTRTLLDFHAHPQQ